MMISPLSVIFLKGALPLKITDNDSNLDQDKALSKFKVNSKKTFDFFSTQQRWIDWSGQVLPEKLSIMS